jgi:hypothetical protein
LKIPRECKRMVGQTKKIRASDALTASELSHIIFPRDCALRSFTDVLVSSIGGSVLRRTSFCVSQDLHVGNRRRFDIIWSNHNKKKNLIEL